jgi:hypothetical protein
MWKNVVLGYGAVIRDGAPIQMEKFKLFSRLLLGAIVVLFAGFIGSDKTTCCTYQLPLPIFGSATPPPEFISAGVWLLLF